MQLAEEIFFQILDVNMMCEMYLLCFLSIGSCLCPQFDFNSFQIRVNTSNVCMYMYRNEDIKEYHMFIALNS